MSYFKGKKYWAVILGGSSGIGLATANKLAAEGMHLCIIHRDRRSRAEEIENSFNHMRSNGVQVQSFNLDALKNEKCQEVIQFLMEELNGTGKIRTLVHCISKGNLKLLTSKQHQSLTTAFLQHEAGLESNAPLKLYADLHSSLIQTTGSPPMSGQDFQLTIQAMAISLYDWVKALFNQNLFAEDARIIGLTSEGNNKAWPYYAAVSAAKAALESIVRAIALEFAPFGIRANIVQAGVTDTPSLRLIPGQDHLKLNALLRNPFKRLTRPEDIANAIYLLTRDEAAWINGALIPVDGGERIA